MTGHRMAAVDAQFLWTSAKIPSDEFLLYAFAGEPADLARAVEQVCDRARTCPDLSMRVQEGCALTYPRWVPTVVGPDWVRRHTLSDGSWRDCLAVLAGLAADQVDVRETPWRLHVFTPVFGIPEVSDPGTVAVLQIAHAVADGARASAMAAWLFGRDIPVPEIHWQRRGFLPWRALQAARAHRDLVRDIEAGLVTPGPQPRPPQATNNRPEGAREMRTLVRKRSQLSGSTITVRVLAAVSEALSGLLGGPIETLGAEVPMAKSGVPHAYNHFGNVVVGLYPQLSYEERMRRIADELANARRRLGHPASYSGSRAFAAVPAALLRWGVSQFDAEARPTQVAGNTVVSSVHRGAADLSFGECPVVLTAGYPALSPCMGLTHGVHGIGDTIAISVHAAESVVPDVDGYLQLLDAAL
ncbi:WS/DGAT domain-containing protein [Mycobacterium bourgelatii]|uniref:DUF1298 domain-containing protein n=1 Tax=Mycobacterium bourgelatii TaxID=1273442 RepID=A0A7I9YUV5_MYCBU|nr:WS/DGAT domain-containing protein [Mycobacterium bourgelatii]GFG92388.1 DUF1298 domain-containing protein [Mycobacterium bourgelatii]